MAAKATAMGKQIKTRGLYIKSVISTAGVLAPNPEHIDRKIQFNDDIRIVGWTAQLDQWQDDYADVVVGYHACHLWLGVVPFTTDDINGLVVPSGILDELQSLVEHLDGGALTYMTVGENAPRTRVMFPEGMGIDLDKYDYFYASLHNISSGYSTDLINSLCRIKVMYVER